MSSISPPKYLSTPAQVRSSRCCCAVLPGGTGSSGYWYLSWSSENVMRSAKRMVSAIASGRSRNSRAISSARLQMALGIGFEPLADGVDRGLLADAGQHVLQRAARGMVIQHLVGREQRHVCRRARCDAAAPAGAGRRRDRAGLRPARRHRRGLAFSRSRIFVAAAVSKRCGRSAPEAGLRQIPGDRRISDGIRPSRSASMSSPRLPRVSNWHSRP